MELIEAGPIASVCISTVYAFWQCPSSRPAASPALIPKLSAMMMIMMVLMIIMLLTMVIRAANLITFWTRVSWIAFAHILIGNLFYSETDTIGQATSQIWRSAPGRRLGMPYAIRVNYHFTSILYFIVFAVTMFGCSHSCTRQNCTLYITTKQNIAENTLALHQNTELIDPISAVYDVW